MFPGLPKPTISFIFSIIPRVIFDAMTPGTKNGNAPLGRGASALVNLLCLYYTILCEKCQ